MSTQRRARYDVNKQTGGHRYIPRWCRDVPKVMADGGGDIRHDPGTKIPIWLGGTRPRWGNPRTTAKTCDENNRMYFWIGCSEACSWALPPSFTAHLSIALCWMQKFKGALRPLPLGKFAEDVTRIFDFEFCLADDFESSFALCDLFSRQLFWHIWLWTSWRSNKPCYNLPTTFS